MKQKDIRYQQKIYWMSQNRKKTIVQQLCKMGYSKDLSGDI